MYLVRTNQYLYFQANTSYNPIWTLTQKFNANYNPTLFQPNGFQPGVRTQKKTGFRIWISIQTRIITWKSEKLKSKPKNPKSKPECIYFI